MGPSGFVFRVGRYADAVASFRFAAVQSAVGLRYQAVQGVANLVLHDAETAGELNRVFGSQLPDAFLDPDDEFPCFRQSRLRRKDDEFVASPAREDVRLPDHALDELGQAEQDPITASMTPGIIDLLEIVDVHDDQDEAGTMTFGPFDLNRRQFVDLIPVVDLCQDIGFRDFSDVVKFPVLFVLEDGGMGEDILVYELDLLFFRLERVERGAKAFQLLDGCRVRGFGGNLVIPFDPALRLFPVGHPVLHCFNARIQHGSM
jgi:hypothetical protein